MCGGSGRSPRSADLCREKDDSVVWETTEWVPPCVCMGDIGIGPSDISWVCSGHDILSFHPISRHCVSRRRPAT